MVQCCMCEDWYHDIHLGLEGDLPGDFDEIICKDCVKRHSFLLNYQNITPGDSLLFISSYCLSKSLKKTIISSVRIF